MLQLVPVQSLKQLEAEAKRVSEAENRQPVIQGLAAHVSKRWESLRQSKHELEQRMLQCLRQRRMEYDPDKLQAIREQGGSEIYMGVTSVKCRAATSWLRDSLLGTGVDKPWKLHMTPVADLPPDILEDMQRQLTEQLFAGHMQGQPLPDPETLKKMAQDMKDGALRAAREEAEKRVARMESKMEDQLIEGGFIRALHEGTDDLATFPFACIKGPIIRKRKTLEWRNGGLVPTTILRPEWERVDPFRVYWAPWVSDANDGPIIELHKLTRPDLEALIGVDGYSDSAILSVLSDFGGAGLYSDNTIESSKADAEGRDTGFDNGSDDTVEALQLWDTVQGKLLIEWGLDESEIDDPLMSYPCEVWVVKGTVIRAVLNYDPLGRKPYYFTSYEKIPGMVAGNGVADLCRDSQNMCNAAARALANNMGIASGPMVWINIDRLPAGEDITQLSPWRIFQGKSPDYQDNQRPIEFFQPGSNASELMAVFERFSIRADEDTGIPRYMTGEHVPGAGRTSSGLSMLISNAGKGIKQVISNIDHDWLTPLLERLYQHNLRYSQDPDLIGDVNIVAKGAMSLVVKEAEAVRQREFLQMVLQSPVAQQVVGMSGTAELIREAARNLNGNVDRIVPPREAILQKEQQAQMMQQMMAMAQGAQQMPGPKNLQADGSEQGGRSAEGNFISPRPNGE